MVFKSGNPGGNGNSYTIPSTGTNITFAPNIISTISTGSAGSWVTTTPACPGHVTDASLIEYQDGIVIAYCKLCEARITLERLPGGVNKAKLTTILANLRNQEPDLQDVILDAVLELEIDIIEELEELQNALTLLRAAKDEACRRLN